MPSNFEQLVFEIIATDRTASAAFDRFRAKVDQTSRSVDDSTGKLDKNAKSLENLGTKADNAGSVLSSLAVPGGGMGALIGAGVALAPVLATVGTGLGGLALGAYGAISPVLKAAHAAGGLQANMSKLDPEQRKLAVSILALGRQYAAFEKQLQPQVLAIFGKGIQLAGHLMKDVEPVAKATGIAIGTLLDHVDAEFASGTWQKFFTWMGTQAGPDIKLLGDAFINLLDALPGVLKALQPVSLELLHQVDVASVLIRDLSLLGDNTTTAGHAAATAAKSHNILADAFRNTLHFMAPELPLAQQIQHWLLKQGGAAATSAKGLNDAAASAVKAHAPFFNLNTAVTTLNKSMTTLIGNLLTLQGDNVTWRQSMEAARKQLDSNSAGLAGNSKNALANKSAVIQSTNAAITFASQQLTLKKDLGQASDTIQAQIRFLQGLHDKSAFTKNEIEALRQEEARLNRQRINQTINVQGLGQWSVSQSLAPGAGHRRAAGGLIPGTGNTDNYPALLTPGEVVIPKPMVSAGMVDHLRGLLPGFASGGLVPSYSGGVGGVWPWIKGNDAATIQLMDEAIVRAVTAGMRAAQSAAASFGGGTGGPASGAVRALQQYAASLFPQYGWSAAVQLPPLIALWNGESGWNPNARNPTSGAFGIPQALPPGKMGALAASGNAAAQIRWGESYIAGVYGTPAEAYGMWLSRSPHWYDQGGYLPPGLSLAYNGTGRPERVGGGGGNTYNINVTAPVGSNPKDIGRVIVGYIKSFEQGSGSGWRR